MMLVPALARTAVRNPALQCMNNLQQLQRASAMYAADNSGKLAANLGSFTYSYNAWCTGVLDWNSGVGAGSLGETVSSNLNTNYLLKSELGPYTGSRASVYKCPADKVPSAIGPRVRSYSMNGFAGGTAEQTIYGYTAYRAFLKDSDFTTPGAAKTFVFIDEHPDSINDCLFALKMAAATLWPSYTTWDDLPASSHNGACALSFADGHVEVKKWQDPQTLVPIQKTNPAGVPGVNGYGATSFHDNAWMAARTTAPK
jgi:prepilin-type processing-associated H-X9-DG protein